jgi:hypothetical protein
MKFISPNQDYPRHIGDIQLAHPSYKAGDSLPDGWVQVVEVERPKAGKDEITVEGFPVEVDGVTTQNWIIRAMTAEEIERRDAPANAKAKLIELGLTEVEVEALVRGLVR